MVTVWWSAAGLIHHSFLNAREPITSEKYAQQTDAATANLCQSCLTLCDPTDSSPLGSAVLGILQARTRVGCHFLLQCMKVKMKVKPLSCFQLLVTPWTAAQAPPSMGFSRQEYWSGVLLPSPQQTDEMQPNLQLLQLALVNKKGKLFSMTTPDCTSHNQHFKS